MTNRYIALIYPHEGGFDAVFPDFPGCVAASDDMDDVITQAAQALSIHVASMRADSDPIPAASSLAQVKAMDEEWINLDQAIVASVPLLPRGNKAKAINITLDEGLLEVIDTQAKALKMTRSDFLAEGARRLLTDAA